MTETLLAIDPGLRACGCALFKDGRLVAASLVESGSIADRDGAWRPMAYAVRAWVGIVGVQVSSLAIELPQVYHNKIETDQNDLIQLSAVVGAICHEFKNVDATTVYLPAQWKGQAPKHVVHARMNKRLDDRERDVLPRLAKSKLHNVLDGVSIGLVRLGRL